MNDPDIDRRVDTGLAMGCVVFIVVYGLIIVLCGGWGLALGWIGAIMLAAPTVYVFSRSETLVRSVDALFAVLFIWP